MNPNEIIVKFRQESKTAAAVENALRRKWTGSPTLALSLTAEQEAPSKLLSKNLLDILGDGISIRPLFGALQRAMYKENLSEAQALSSMFRNGKPSLAVTPNFSRLYVIRKSGNADDSRTLCNKLLRRPSTSV